MANACIRVLIADDHPVVVNGLRDMLQRAEGIEVVGHAADGEEVVRLAAELAPDVVVMDVLMPGKDGIEACREIREMAPATKVVMLTASTERDGVIKAMAAGAAGYLEKVSGMERFLETVRGVAAGELRVPADVVLRTMKELNADVEVPGSRAAGLTQREQEILTLFARGTTYAEIAKERGVKTATIRNAIYGIQEKLEVSTNQELVIWAMRNGLLDDYKLVSSSD